MRIFRISLGRLDVEVHLPETVLDAMLPAYLLPVVHDAVVHDAVAADAFPEGTLRLWFAPLSETPPHADDISGRFALGRAACVAPAAALDGEPWRFFVHLPEGPDRPDRLPTKCVLPCLSIALERLGIHTLHASAVIIADTAVLIAGATGHGKSTTAAALTSLGAAPLADDRVLIQRREDGWIATASPERPNPFARRAGYPAEHGPMPLRVADDRTRVVPVGQLVFPEVVPGAPSSIEPLSPARTAALFAAAGGPPAVNADTRIGTAAPPLPPAVRLTLGTDAATILSRFCTS